MESDKRKLQYKLHKYHEAADSLQNKNSVIEVHGENTPSGLTKGMKVIGALIGVLLFMMCR